ncbi:MAG: hypothetical protein R3C03_21075 [Pirellulaceae bacterium]
MKMKILSLFLCVLCISSVGWSQTDAFVVPKFEFPETTSKFDWNKIASISASDDGVGGVLFLQDNRDQKIVLKFVGEDAAAMVYADNVLSILKVPNPNSAMLRRGDAPESSAKKLSFEKVLSLLQPELKPNTNPVNERLQKVFQNSDDAQAVVLMRRIRATGESWSLSDVLNGTSKSDAFNPQMLLCKALNTPIQSQVLGRLLIADAILGNGDRFDEGRITNAGNIMLTSKAQFVSIDNFSDLSSMKEIAWWLLSEKIIDQFTGGKLPEELKEFEITYEQYVDKLTTGFRRDGIPSPNLSKLLNWI